MTPFIDSTLFKKKAEKKTLALVLSEGENVLSCIRQAMKDHGVRECNVGDINGKIRLGLINFFERSQFKSLRLENQAMLRASGRFKLSGGDLWGSMNVSTAGKKVTTGTFVRGTAAEGLEIKLGFVKDR